MADQQATDNFQQIQKTSVDADSVLSILSGSQMVVYTSYDVPEGSILNVNEGAELIIIQ